MAEACSATCVIVGPWDAVAKTPSFFYGSLDGKTNLPQGWIFQHKRYLAHGNVPVQRGLCCPKHALEWRAYVKLVDDWYADHIRSRSLIDSIKRVFSSRNDPPDPPAAFRLRHHYAI